MQPSDLPHVLAVQRACYGAEFVESAEVFARRLAAAPATAWVITGLTTPLCAYLSAYPSSEGQITALHGDFKVEGTRADTLYLHDLAVHPTMHGQRLGQRLVRHAWAFAARQGWPQSSLVSVQGSLAFWQALDYSCVDLRDAQQLATLATYEKEARYMVRRL